MSVAASSATKCSVVICTFNGERRLPATLQHLAAQTGLPPSAWEVIVVDNASNDQSAELCQSIWLSMNTGVPMRVIAEPTPGLTHARIRGVGAASGAIIVFVDDDNWLDANYLQVACELLDQHPEIAICGGRTEPVFESARPAWFEQHSNWFAVGSQAAQSGEVTCVWGCGLTIRAEVARRFLRPDTTGLLNDRTGSSLSSGGDTELCLRAAVAGYKAWYSEQLRLSHWMPQSRMDWTHLIKLIFAIGADESQLKRYRLQLQRRKQDRAWLRWYADSRLLQLAWCVTALMAHIVRNPRSLMVNEEGNRQAVPLVFRLGNAAGLLRR